MALVEEVPFGFKDESIFIDYLSPNDLREEEVIAVQDVELSEGASKEDHISKESQILPSDRNERSPLKTHECSRCSKMFTTRAKLLKHHRVYHQENVQIGCDGRRLWICSQCQKKFVSRKGWVIHQRSHTGERPYSCLTCGKSFIDSSTLMKHQVIHQAVRPFTCDACGHGFNQKVALKRHEKTHNQQQVFVCGLCPKTFLVKCNLQAHEKLHNGVKPFQCKHCSGTYHTLTALRQHKRVHMNEQRPTGSHCNKASTDSKTLLELKSMHSTTSNLSCPVCPLTFNQRITLRKHIRVHVLRRNVRYCSLCHIVFQSSQETILHFDKHIKVSSKISDCKVGDDCGSAVKEPDKDSDVVKDLNGNGVYINDADDSGHYSADSMMEASGANKMEDLMILKGTTVANYSTDGRMMKYSEDNISNMGSSDENSKNNSTGCEVRVSFSQKYVNDLGVDAVNGNNSLGSLIHKKDVQKGEEVDNELIHRISSVKDESNGSLIQTNNIVRKEEKYSHIKDHMCSGSDVVHDIINRSICNEGIQKIELDMGWNENSNQSNHKEVIEKSEANGHAFEEATSVLGFSRLEALCNVAVSAAKELTDFHEPAVLEGTGVVFVKTEKSSTKNKLSSPRFNGIRFFCKTCKRMYSSTVEFRKHRCTLSTVGRRKGKVAGSQSKVFACDECNKSFRSKNGFLIHQRSHTGERPYACRWCGKAFGDSGTRHKHERIHTGERPFQCNYCPRAFNQRAALRAHQVTHSACFTRTHTCQLCPSSFSYFANLRRHVVTCHREYNAITCPLCTLNKTLHYDTSSLHEHVRTAHWAPGDRLECPICDMKDFKNVSAYCSHIVCHSKCELDSSEVQLNNNTIEQELC